MAIDPQLLTGLGSVLSIFLTAAGSAVATSHAGIFAVRGKDTKSFAPIVISGVLAIYGIIVSILLVGKFKAVDSMTQIDGYRNLSAGLAVGLACCASGFGMASFIKQLNMEPRFNYAENSPTSELMTPLVGRRTEAIVEQQGQPPNFIHLCMCLAFLEAIGLYGLIVALFLMG